MALPPSSSAPRSHSDRKPFRHGWHWPQAGMNARMTWSPSADAGDVLADLGDDAGALVAAECGQADRGGPGGQVVVGVAHARRVHADLDLVGNRVAHLDLVDFERRVELPQQSTLTRDLEHVTKHASSSLLTSPIRGSDRVVLRDIDVLQRVTRTLSARRRFGRERPRLELRGQPEFLEQRGVEERHHVRHPARRDGQDMQLEGHVLAGPSRMYIAAAGCPLAVVGISRMSPAASAGHFSRDSVPMASGPWYQPSNGGISQIASSVNNSTSLSMS